MICHSLSTSCIDLSSRCPYNSTYEYKELLRVHVWIHLVRRCRKCLRFSPPPVIYPFSSDIDDSDPLQWIQLTWGYPQFKTKFDAQVSHLKLVIDACYAQLGLQAPPIEIPSLLSLRRRVYRSVSLCDGLLYMGS